MQPGLQTHGIIIHLSTGLDLKSIATSYFVGCIDWNCNIFGQGAMYRIQPWNPKWNSLFGIHAERPKQIWFKANQSYLPIKPKSAFNPRIKNAVIETYLSCLEESLLDIEIPSKGFTNLTKIKEMQCIAWKMINL